jgi:hypothetical protein
MKSLLAILLILGLSVTSIKSKELPDPDGPVCLIYAQWAYDRAHQNPNVKWAEIIEGKLCWELTPTALPEHGVNEVAPELPPSNLRHAICIWQQNDEIWVEDTWINMGRPYKAPTLTKYLREGKAITPELAFTIFHRKATDIDVARHFEK